MLSAKSSEPAGRKNGYFENGTGSTVFQATLESSARPTLLCEKTVSAYLIISGVSVASSSCTYSTCMGERRSKLPRSCCFACLDSRWHSVSALHVDSGHCSRSSQLFLSPRGVNRTSGTACPMRVPSTWFLCQQQALRCMELPYVPSQSLGRPPAMLQRCEDGR